MKEMINDYIPTALLFFSVLSEEEIEFIHESFYVNKDIYKIMSILQKLKLENQLNCFFSKKKENYTKYLVNLRNEKLMLSGGNYPSLFLK